MSLQLPNYFALGEAGRASANEDTRRNALRQYLQPARQGDQGALSKLYGAGAGDEAMQAEQHMAGTQKAQADALKDQLAQVSAVMASGGDQYAAQLYPQWREMMQKATGTQLPEQYEPGAMQVIQHIAGMKNEQYTLSPGAARYDASGRQIAAQPFAPATPQYKSADDGTLYMVTPQGMQPVPMGGMPAPTTGGGGGALESAVMQVESGGNPNAVSPKGAVGTMQTMPGTLRDPGFGVMPARDNSPAEQERVGKDYLRAMLQKYGDPRLALAAYNAGPGTVDKAMQAGGGVDGVLSRMPAETRAYVPNVLGRAQGGSQVASGPKFGGQNKPMTEAQRLSAENARERLELAKRAAERADKTAATQQQAQRSKPLSAESANKVGLYDNALRAAQQWEQLVVNPDGSFNDVQSRMPQARALLQQALRAKLRAESGASISPAEIDGEIDRYLGSFFASDGTNTQKAKALVADLAQQRGVLVSGRSEGGARTVVRTGIHNGRKVVQYSDGTTDYAD